MGGGLLSFRLDEHAGKWLPHTELLLLGFPKMQIKSTYPKSKLGLDRTGHMSFLIRQDRTPKFAGQVLSDWTESGLIISNILL